MRTGPFANSGAFVGKLVCFGGGPGDAIFLGNHAVQTVGGPTHEFSQNGETRVRAARWPARGRTNSLSGARETAAIALRPSNPVATNAVRQNRTTGCQHSERACHRSEINFRGRCNYLCDCLPGLGQKDQQRASGNGKKSGAWLSLHRRS